MAPTFWPLPGKAPGKAFFLILLNTLVAAYAGIVEDFARLRKAGGERYVWEFGARAEMEWL